MSSYYVSPAGDDTTGDGSFAAPFKTIGKAATVAVGAPVDSIEVGAGTVTETLALTSPVGFSTLRGRGADLTTVVVDVAAWLFWHSFDNPSLLIIGMTVQVLDDNTAVSISATTANPGSIVFARCQCLLGTDSVLIAYSGPDPQDVITAVTVDMLHCVISGPVGNHQGFAVSGVGSPIRNIAARNCIFRRLKNVNKDGTQPFDSDGNFYFDNERDLTLGAYGLRDTRNVDPQLVAGTFQPLLSSPLRQAGIDLSNGYGDLSRTPVAEVGLLFSGSAPTIGIVELVTLGARTFAIPTNIHTLVLAFSEELELRRQDLLQVERDRSLQNASGIELSRRFGALLGVVFAETDIEAYRKALEQILLAIVHDAPTWHAMRRAAEVLFDRTATLRRSDFNKTYHCKVGSTLKLWADASGGLPTYTFYLTDGEILLEDRWIRVRKVTFVEAHTTHVYTLYVDGSAPVDGNGEAIVRISSSPVSDESLTALSGVFTFRKGETKVTTTADLSSIVEPHRRIAIGFGPSDYVVDSVEDARNLTLRHPFPDDDHVGLAWAVTPNVIFGTVAIDAATGITRIVCPGRIGRTMVPLTKETRGFGYQLTLDMNGTALADATSIVVSLFEILGRMHPIHKLGYFKLRDDVQSLVLAQPWPYDQQSTADYSEIFDDPAWFSI